METMAINDIKVEEVETVEIEEAGSEQELRLELSMAVYNHFRNKKQPSYTSAPKNVGEYNTLSPCGTWFFSGQEDTPVRLDRSYTSIELEMLFAAWRAKRAAWARVQESGIFYGDDGMAETPEQIAHCATIHTLDAIERWLRR